MTKILVILVLALASVVLVGSLASLIAGMIYNTGGLIAVAFVGTIVSFVMIEGAFAIDQRNL